MSITSTGSSTSLAQLRQLQQAAFKTADADNDGKLSLSEFQSIGQNVPGQPARPPMRGAGGPGDRFGGDTLSALLSTQSADDLSGSVIKSGDTDGDGELSASEISAALTAKAPDAATGLGDKMASGIVSALDTDGDGSLSSSEISSAITKAASDESSARASGRVHGHHHHHGGGAPSGAGEAEGASGTFEALDTNKDGAVSAEELAAANTDGTGATDAASSLIKAADQDGDGALSGGEFQALLDQGKAADASPTVASLMSGSTAASDLMRKLLAQLDMAMGSKSGGASAGVSTTA